LKNKFFLQFLFLFALFIFAAAKMGLLTFPRLPCVTRPAGCVTQARRASPSVESLQVCHFFVMD
jgi:hypothetical protein